MSERVSDSGWIAEATVLLDHFKVLPDPRQQAKVIYRLDERLLQSLLAVLGCQRDIAARIIAERANYTLALKGNQGTLRGDVELFANEQKTRHPPTSRRCATSPITSSGARRARTPSASDGKPQQGTTPIPSASSQHEHDQLARFL